MLNDASMKISYTKSTLKSDSGGDAWGCFPIRETEFPASSEVFLISIEYSCFITYKLFNFILDWLFFFGDHYCETNSVVEIILS